MLLLVLEKEMPLDEVIFTTREWNFKLFMIFGTG